MMPGQHIPGSQAQHYINWLHENVGKSGSLAEYPWRKSWTMAFVSLCAMVKSWISINFHLSESSFLAAIPNIILDPLCLDPPCFGWQCPHISVCKISWIFTFCQRNCNVFIAFGDKRNRSIYIKTFCITSFCRTVYPVARWSTRHVAVFVPWEVRTNPCPLNWSDVHKSSCWQV